MKIRQIELLTSKLAETEQFYSEILELECVERSKTSLTFAIGASKLIFRETDILGPIYHFAFNIPNNRLPEAESWLSRKVSLISFENSFIIDFKNWNARSVYFFDNNGNILECIARYDLNNSSEEEFGDSSFLSVSEIGLVTENVPALAKSLMHEKGIPPYGKQPQSLHFSALGDDHGLLILSDNQRNWFPTTERAQTFPVRLQIESESGLQEIHYV